MTGLPAERPSVCRDEPDGSVPRARRSADGRARPADPGRRVRPERDRRRRRSSSIEGSLSRADPSLRADWRRSLEQLDDLALARGGAGFAELDEATQDDLLEVVAAGGAPAM